MIVKLTLTGLAAGEKVETGYLQFGNSFKVVGNVEYDPELGRVDFLTQVYLARPSYVQMTDNQGSYGSSYFVQTYSYFMNTGLSYELKLYDLAADTYLPLAY